MSLIKRLLPKPRSGKLTQTRFDAKGAAGPVAQARSIKSSLSEGGEVVEQRESTSVSLWNGNSLTSDGELVTVKKQGVPDTSFTGAIKVEEDRVTVHDKANTTSLVFTDNGNSLISEQGEISQLDGSDRKPKTASVLGQDWLLA